MARLAFKPTEKQRKQVEQMAAAQVSQKHMARILGISHMTLRKHFTDELDNGRAIVVAEAVGKLREGVLAGVPACIIYTLRCLGGETWAQRQKVVHQNPDGTPLFDDWPSEKLLPALRRGVEVLEAKGVSHKKNGTDAR